MPKLNRQKGFALVPVLVLIIAIVGLVLGVYLSKIPQIFNPKASDDNYAMRALPRTVPDDPFYAGRAVVTEVAQNGYLKQDHLDLINMQIAWGLAMEKFDYDKGREIRVVIIDSGIDKEHEDLKGVRVEGGYNFITNTSADEDLVDDVGHGTEIAGIISGVTNNNIGTAGVSGNGWLIDNLIIVPYKIWDKNNYYLSPYLEIYGEGWNGDNAQIIGNQFTEYWVRIANAIKRAIRLKRDKGGVVIVNMSFQPGYKSCDLVQQQHFRDWAGPIVRDEEVIRLREAISEAQKSGIVIISSVGNNKEEVRTIPNSCPGVIGVGATGSDGRIWTASDGLRGSNKGVDVKISAPGENIVTLLPRDCVFCDKFQNRRGYQKESGVSYAAAQVTGVVALLQSRTNYILSPNEVRDCLVQNADQNHKSKDDFIGPFLDAGRTMENCMNLSKPD